MQIIIHSAVRKYSSPTIEEIEILDSEFNALVITVGQGCFDETFLDIEMDDEFSIPVKFEYTNK